MHHVRGINQEKFQKVILDNSLPALDYLRIYANP